MREIKFRAWHKELKQIKECFAINFAGNRTVGVHDDDPIWFFEDIILMQFTGLHDKNGKEICESDLVSVNGNDPSLVKWRDQCADFILDHIYSVGKDGIFKSESSRYEVLGNIYENPELLK